MSAIENTQPFKPAFCHRSDCTANPASPYCSSCGADIAAYLEATAPSPPATTTADEQTNRLFVVHEHAADTSAPVPAAAAAAGTSRPSWREPAVLAAFATATVVGALGALVGNLA
jgi:hypothetical protein